MKSSVTKPNEKVSMSRKPKYRYADCSLKNKNEFISCIHNPCVCGLTSRCHIVLLSTQHCSVLQIAALLVSLEDTVAVFMSLIDLAWKGFASKENGTTYQDHGRDSKQMLELVESDPRDLQLPLRPGQQICWHWFSKRRPSWW